MDIAIIGAGGSVGRMVTQLIVSEQIIDKSERLILVGNPEGMSAQSLPGFAVDLMDGYAEISPQIDVLFDVSCLQCDLIVMAAGATLPSDLNQMASRDQLAQLNFPVFNHFAQKLAECSSGHEIVLCVTNPNELCVSVFAHYLGRKRVVGVGAFLDSLRFRREIANDLNIRRQTIHGFMVGEHGANLVPLWSSVHIFGYDLSELNEAVLKIRKGHRTENFYQDVKNIYQSLKDDVKKGAITEAYHMLNQYPPDIRTMLKPFITHFSGSKTITGTARATMDFIRAITSGSDALISGQVVLEGEFHNMYGTLGVPFVIGNRGVERVIELPVDDEEKALLYQCIHEVDEKNRTFLKQLS